MLGKDRNYALFYGDERKPQTDSRGAFRGSVRRSLKTEGGEPMRKLALCLMLAALTFSAATKKSMKAPSHKVMAASAIQWGDAPPSLPKGAKLAVLEGDPSKKGFFVIRIKAPDG